MTAINVFRGRRRVVVMTDGAAYDRDGVVGGFGLKCAALPHLGAALATRGSMTALPFYAAILGSTFTTFDGLVARGAGTIEAIYDGRLYDFARSGESEIELILAGWSTARGRAESYAIASTVSEWGIAGAEPFQMQELPPATTAPTILEPGFAERLGFRSYDDFEWFDPVKHGLLIMEQQRRQRHHCTTAKDGGEHHIVGAFCLSTEIVEGQVLQRVLRRWPDMIGERIQPGEDRELELVTAGESPLRRQMRERREAKRARR